ncbi:MAG: SCO family protein [Xanthomonadales bacterium]|nr:SCO family protein [Xanthomonadales bacterium]
MPSRWLLLLIGLGAFGLGAWLALGPGAPKEPETKAGYVLDEARALPALSLIDEQGQPFTNADFEGQWSLLYFGFTYCPDICPSALGVMAQIKRELDDDASINDHYFLVSVDPERDTPERLREYVQYFDPSFQAVTGEFAQLDQFTRTAGAIYRLPEERAGEDYQVAHSSTLTLINPQGRLHAVFTAPFDAQLIAQDLQQLAR